MRYFYLDESPNYEHRYLIRINFDLLKKRFPNGIVGGSYGVLVARVLNLPYYKYLRFARDVCGAELRGKGSNIVTAYYPETATTQQLVKLLNKRMDLIMDMSLNPYDYQYKDGTLTKVPIKK